MLTKTLIDKFYEDVERLGLKFPVAAICKATKFGKGQVSDYLKKNKQPSQNFLNAFYKAFESSINVPRPTIAPQEAQKDGISENGNNGERKDYPPGKNIDTLYEAHGKVIDTNAKLAEANYLLAVSIARVLPETRQDQGWPPKLAEWVQEFYSGKKMVPIDELLKELQKASMPNNSYKQ